LKKNDGFVNVPRGWTGDMDVICSNCGERFGVHSELECRDGKGVFSKRVRKPLKTAVAVKTSLNKRSAAPKTTPKSAKRRLRTA
jgi:hypothetical protein